MSMAGGMLLGYVTNSQFFISHNNISSTFNSQLSSSTGFVNKLVQTPLSLDVTPSSIKYGQNATVTWKVPKDEATHKDWIGT